MKLLSESRRVGLLVIILAAVAGVSVGATISVLYRAALNLQRERLHDLADSEARLVEAIVQRELTAGGTPDTAGSEAALATTLRILKSAHSHFTGLGTTGELVLARREGDSIVYLLLRRHDE